MYNHDYYNDDYTNIMFIGRESELAFLQGQMDKPQGSLIVLYGRRRVGKTELLRQFCHGKDALFFTCTEVPDTQQLTAFSQAVLKRGIPASKYIDRFTSWEDAFSALAEIPAYGKKIVVIDEFPYMARANPAIPSILQKIWDTFLKNQDVMLVLCGSAMSFIEKEILSEKNPLYGRATGILQIKEMGFYDAIQFVPDYSAEDKIATYAIVGGIPHYLKQFDPAQSLADNVIDSILTRGSILFSEVEFLLRQELRETATYNTIIEAIALGNTRLNDIHTCTQIERTKLSAYLRNLIDLGIVFREFSVDTPLKEKAKSQRGLYRLSTAYFRFWYHFVFPNLSALEIGDANGVWHEDIAPQMNAFISTAFEDICCQYLKRLNLARRLPFRFSNIGRYWSAESEIDLMAFDRGQKNLLFGECKYRNAPAGEDVLAALKAKAEAFSSTTASPTFMLFSKGGFSERLDASQNDAVSLVDLETLIEG